MNLIGTHPRPLAIITGAYGGTGRAVARRLGARYRLVLTGHSEAGVKQLRESLDEEGYDVALAQVTDVASPESVAELAAATRAAGTFGTLVHLAGLSPALADWKTVVTVNLRGTASLLDAFLPLAVPGSSAVCVGSVAAYTFQSRPEIDAVLDEPQAEDLIERLEPLLRHADEDPDGYGFTVRAYGASKYGTLRRVERSAEAWAQYGARIVSVSPGLIVTPMGRAELAANPLAVRAADLTPLRRLGMPSDIATAIDFLVSDNASYITGCDLRVDGGISAARRHSTPR